MRSTSTARGANGLKTPAYLKASYPSDENSPGLPEMSYVDEEDTTDDQPTPLPQMSSSSAQSTPLPSLLGKKGDGILSDGQNMMTLKEQEKVCSDVVSGPRETDCYRSSTNWIRTTLDSN